MACRFGVYWFFIGKCLNYRGFLEQRQAENLQDFAEAPFALEFLANDGYQHVHADGDPYLGLHRVLACAVERFDAQVLFDPFEEQFHLPAALVQPGNGQGGQIEVVRQEHQATVVFRVVKDDATQGGGVQACRFQPRQDDGLIAAQTRGLVDGAARASDAVEIAFAARDEERAGHRKAVQALKIDVAAIHHIERASLDRELIEYVDIVHFPAGNVDKTWNVAAQVEQGVQLDRSLATAKSSPRKELQTQIDGRRIERVNGFGEQRTQRFVRVEAPRPSDQDLGEVGVDPPIVDPIGIGQCAPRDRPSKARMVQFGGNGTQAGLDVAQTFAKRQLREGQTKKLIAAREATQPTIAVVAANAGVELVTRQKVHQLGKYQLTSIHASSSQVGKGLPTRNSDGSM
jgi:hypothetical protein